MDTLESYTDTCILIYDTLKQGWASLSLKIHYPAEFSSDPNQKHLNELTKVFRITEKLHTCEFNQGWSKFLQESGYRGTEVSSHAFKLGTLIKRIFFFFLEIYGCFRVMPTYQTCFRDALEYVWPSRSTVL